VGAIGERVAIPPVAGIEHVGEARRAGRRVGHDAGRDFSAFTCRDVERRARRWFCEGRARDLLDAGEGRRIGHDGGFEGSERRTRSPGSDQHSGAVVQHLTRQAMGAGMSPDRRTEADTLHEAGDAQLDTGGDRTILAGLEVHARLLNVPCRPCRDRMSERCAGPRWGRSLPGVPVLRRELARTRPVCRRYRAARNSTSSVQ